jgi:hypothetical protein
MKSIVEDIIRVRAINVKVQSQCPTEEDWVLGNDPNLGSELMEWDPGDICIISTYPYPTYPTHQSRFCLE